MPDKKALKILFETYWSSTGWKTKPDTPPDDLAYAKTAGYLFDPVEVSHDEIVDWLLQSYERVTLSEVTNAFLASLGSRRLELRSALGSYAIARNFPHHSFTGNELSCDVCGLYNSTKQEEDLSVLNFERYKWGGLRHLDPLYVAFDLQLFSSLEKLAPTEEDQELLRKMIDCARRCNADARIRDVEKAFAPIIKSNKAEREVVIQILSYCGIFQPKEKPGFFASFVNAAERPLPPASKIDWDYPVCWWRGKDGINEEPLQFYFSQLNT